MSPWQPYSEAALQELRSNGHAVFINLTADWCITCLANEKLALSSEKFLATLKEQNITYLKGDWTNYNPEITQLLNRHHRTAIVPTSSLKSRKKAVTAFPSPQSID